MKVIVLAGGRGTRLWPLSSEMCPKQFLGLGMENSLLEQTVRRFNEEDVVVITAPKYVDRVHDELGTSFKGTVLVEPESRNTAPAICYTIKHCIHKLGMSDEELCMVCPSDHYFATEQDLQRLLPIATDSASRGDIVTFGVQPTYPDTGYGYIQIALEGDLVYPVMRFIEKPSRLRAQEFLDCGNYYWNMGIFVFQIKTFLKELQDHAPVFSRWFMQPYHQAMEMFPQLPADSIDRVLMEKTRQMVLIPFPSQWSDLGTWERLLAAVPTNGAQNFFSGKVHAVDTTGCMVFGEHITTIGVEDLIIINVAGRVVVCKKDAVDRLHELQFDNVRAHQKDPY